jgi:hypothetical protein
MMVEIERGKSKADRSVLSSANYQSSTHVGQPAAFGVPLKQLISDTSMSRTTSVN